MFSCSVVITTYNRPQKVLELVQQLQLVQPSVQEIIVVDSSNESNAVLTDRIGVKYVRSTHKNQPYQRYLGFLEASETYVLFLDDDMEVIEPSFISKIETLIASEQAIGLALNFKDKHQDTTLSAVPKSALFKRSKWLKYFKNWFTGYADLPEGTLGYCGNRGKQPNHIAPTQYVSGGAFVVKRTELFQNFNFQLFDLFEERMGMGEDALIGYGIHKRGKLLFVPDIFFLHNDQKDSSYSMNVHDYARRVLFSRLFLSLEKTRLDAGSLTFARLHYHWYAFWRLIGIALNAILIRNEKRKQILFGSWKGWKDSHRFHFDNRLERQIFWQNEINKNLNK